MSDRVGIVTINDDANFGNRLQNYALQRALTSLGWRPETIRNTPPAMSRRLLASRVWHAVRHDPAGFVARNVQLVGNRLRQSSPKVQPKYADRRTAAIARFAAQEIIHTEEEFWSSGPERWEGRYDKVIVGSDQVWNHGFRNAHEIDFLTFAPPERRVAYAASFGVAEVPTFLQSRYRTRLNEIPHISVREHRGAEIVRSLTGREVPVVVDPTLLLDRDRWEALGELPEQLRGAPYAVRFFLGGDTREQEVLVRALAEERGARLIDLHDLEQEEFADLGPAGFVAAVGRAEFLATDSFHAGVFALIQHTPIVVRARHRTDSRLQSLFELHGITTRPASDSGLLTALDPDWQRADDRLAEEREASWSFLSGALGSPRSVQGG